MSKIITYYPLRILTKLFVTLCFTGVSWSQNSDYELLFQESGYNSYKAQTLVYAATIDLSEIYSSAEPETSSFSIHDTTPPTGLKKKHQSVKNLEKSLIEALKLWPNIKLVTPQKIRNKLESSKSNQRLIKLARQFIEKSELAYRQVDLERAQSLLDSAIELMIQAQYILINPGYLGLVYLKRGMVAIEQKELLRASLDFRKALLLAPYLRLKKNFDHPIAVNIFFQTLQQLQKLSTHELSRLAEQREWIQSEHITLVVVKVKDSVFTAIWQATKETDSLIQSQVNTMDDWVAREHLKLSQKLSMANMVNRLASRLWQCIPVKLRYAIDETVGKNWYFMSGWGALIPTKSPVDFTIQPGIFVETSFSLLAQLSFKIGAMWSNSTQDDAKDLTKPFSHSSVYIGPQWMMNKKLWWVSTGFLLEGSYLGGTEITRTVGCKYFDLESTIPSEICNPSRDIKEIQRTWRIGPRVQFDFGFKVAKSLMIGVQAYGSASLYQTKNHPFEWPVGGGLVIGYSFNSQ